MDQIEEPTLLQTVRAHRGEVTCADTFGARLATGGGDRVLRLFMWQRGAGWAEAAAVASAHRYGVTAARWSPAGALLASAGVDGAVRVWCGRTLKSRRTLAAAGAAAARAVAWAGGARLVAGHDDGAVCVWRVRAATLLARLAAHAGALHAVALPAAGALLLTACTEGVLKVFDFVEVCERGCGPAPAPLAWLERAHDLGALAADAAPDGRHAATGGHDALVRIWRVHVDEGGVRRLEAAGALAGHADTVTALRWAGELLASGALDRTARVWLPRAAACLRVLHAHARYLTAVALAPDLRYLLTGSNDKSVRMWSLGALTLDDELEPPCEPLAHFALGDLEGIGPVDEDDVDEAAVDPAGLEAGARRVWATAAHSAPINCIAVHGDLLATASSDGLVKIFRWSPETETALEEHSMEAHEYPALACDLGAGGALLLSAGLDGCARLWDVQMGCVLRSLSVPGTGGEAGGGGGGVRGARVSPHRPPLLLLATDDGLAPVWTLADDDPLPAHVYGGHVEAATCCAWAGDERVLATGASSGELTVRVPPPLPRDLHTTPHAHDGGVQSCDFAPCGSVADVPDGSYVLASAGADSLLKLWLIELDEEATEARVKPACAVLGHGGGAACVRWGAGGLLASAGGDPWARVWRADAGATELRPVAAVPAGGAGGAPAVALLPGVVAPMLVVGSLTGELALWQLPEEEVTPAPDADDAEPPRYWDENGVVRWLHEYIARVQGVPGALSADTDSALASRARSASVTGARLLDDPVEHLLAVFGYGDEETEGEAEDAVEVRTRLVDELYWLRQPPPPANLAWSAPHGLLCPISHTVLCAPMRAADGRSYARGALREWALAAGPLSPATARPLRHDRLQPNYRLTTALRAYLRLHHQHT